MVRKKETGIQYKEQTFLNQNKNKERSTVQVYFRRKYLSNFKVLSNSA